VTAPAAHCEDALHWLSERGWDLAPLTGQDRAALTAIAHCWALWTRADAAGQRAAVDAVAALLGGCQEIVWPMARELIAHSGDWTHRDAVWPKVVQRFVFTEASQQTGDLGRARRLAHCHAGLPQVQR
jgi:hypothetical protein